MSSERAVLGCIRARPGRIDLTADRLMSQPSRTNEPTPTPKQPAVAAKWWIRHPSEGGSVRGDDTGTASFAKIDILPTDPDACDPGSVAGSWVISQARMGC